MRKAQGLWLHLAHVALLLTATMLDERRVRRPVRPEWDRGLDRLHVAPRDSVHGSAPGALAPRVGAPEVIMPHCPMPVWRPNPDIRYAILVIGGNSPGDAPAARGGASCVNPYARFATDP